MSKSPSTPPRFLNNVIEAIYHLKESGGSNIFKIAKHVKAELTSLDQPRNVSTQVQRALKFAVTNGIIRQRAGKYRINAIVHQQPESFKLCAECRRRKRLLQEQRLRHHEQKVRKQEQEMRHHHQLKMRQRNSSHRTGGRRHAHVKQITKPKSFRNYLFEDDDDKQAVKRRKSVHPRQAPVREAKRRRKKKKGGSSKKRRRRSRRGRQIPVKPKTSDDSLQGPKKKSSSEDFTKDIVYPDDHKGDGGGSEDKKNEESQPSPQCDNPDCLCNINENVENFENSNN